MLQWNTAILDAIAESTMGRGGGAGLGIVNTAMYDSWAAYTALSNGAQLGGGIRQPPANGLPPTRARR